MQTLLVQPININKLNAVKSALKKLDVHYEIQEKEVYNTGFVNKILQGSQEIINGKGTKINITDLWK